MTLLCERCRDAALLEPHPVVMAAQVIAFVDAHSGHDGHAVRVVVQRGARSV